MNIIVAVYSDWGIGKNGTQSIIIPEDRRLFRELTDGGIVVVGRKTFKDIGKPLPNRKCIVLSRSEDYAADGVIVFQKIEDVLEMAARKNTDKVFIIGGGEIYREFLPLCKLAYVTKINATPSSDTFFPDIDALQNWELIRRGDTKEAEGVQYSFNIYKNNHPEDRYV